MDKQTLRYTYLTYFAGQYAKKEDMDYYALVEMAGDNHELCTEVIRDLVDEGLVLGIELIKTKAGYAVGQYQGKLKLTPKGIKEILDIFPEEKEELIDNLNSDVNNYNNKRNRIQESKKDKYLSIKHDMLVLFADIVQSKQYTKNINNKNINQNINSIIKKYYHSAYPRNKEIINELMQEKLITVNYESIKALDDLRKIITVDGIVYLQKNYDYKFEILDKETKNKLEELSFNIKPPFLPSSLVTQTCGISIGLSSDDLKKFAGIYENLPQNHIKQVAGLLNADCYKDAIPNINSDQELATNQLVKNIEKVSTVTNKYIGKKKERNNKSKANEYIFEGILGQNCGDIISPTAQDHIRIQKRGFKVKNGITVLRGYAKSSTIAECSQADNNYQRDKNLKHINALTEFMKKMKTSAKYLPEVTLIARGYNSLETIKISGNLTDTQKGEIDNLNYYRLSVKNDQLYRIDGNHRIEAIKDENYYIPFSIIIWNGNSINEDDEAFLFYFLNSKSKKLTSEENLKGLVNAKNWTDYELQTANVILPYIKYFKENFEGHTLFNKEYYKNSQGVENAKTQILNVLELILKEADNGVLPFDKKTFGDYINKLQEILSQRDRFKYLRENFRCFPQFVFYTLYQYKGNIEIAIRFINEVNKWAEYYKHDSNSFIQPNKIFHNASKQLDRKINIFVAMPYYDKTTVGQFNKTLNSIVQEIKQEDELLREKLNLYPIMTYKAESTDILTNMDKQIGECDIFIADISNHGKNKVNPNVMFELGRVYDKKKFLLIRNKANKITNSAFDIQHIDYIPIDYGMGFDTSMKENLKPRIMNIVKNIIGFC